MALSLVKGTKQVKMGFKYAIAQNIEKENTPLTDGLQNLFQKRILCDAELVCANDKIPCHKSVLAAKSPQFADVFAKDEPSAQRTEVRLYDSSSEACRLLLAYMYDLDTPYTPSNQQVNLEVLQMADTFGLPHLREVCAAFMAKELSTDTVIETICATQKYGLIQLRETILGQLTENKKALRDVAMA